MNYRCGRLCDVHRLIPQVSSVRKVCKLVVVSFKHKSEQNKIPKVARALFSTSDGRRRMKLCAPLSWSALCLGWHQYSCFAVRYVCNYLRYEKPQTKLFDIRCCAQGGIDRGLLAKEVAVC